MRFARALVVAALIFFMAVTPLSALINPGEFEVRFRSEGHSNPWFEPADFGFTVRLLDRTGLVRGLGVSAPRLGVFEPITNYGADDRTLIVGLEGSSCDYLTHLTFERAVTGFLIRERTEGFSCPIGIGMYRAVAVHLWAPVDASTVEFVAHDSE